MNFIRHSNLEGTHAMFSPSQPSWLRYDDDRILEARENQNAAEIGTRLHAWAKSTIDLKLRQPRSKKTLCAYVNDAIGFGMSTEVVLYYSPRIYGTADAICFDENKKILRIHDLKTGRIPAHIEQLGVYAALFCLEYRVKPETIQTELRIYQNDDVLCWNPTPEEVSAIMEQIVHVDEVLEKAEHMEGGYEFSA